MDDTISLGLLLPVGKAQWGEGTDPRELVGLAVAAEQAGDDSLWVNDSLLSPRIEALTMLAAIAPATSRVTIGTAALMPVLRRPVQAAQALASIDLLSGGRLTVAVGAGFPGPLGRPLHDLSEVPWAGRFARLDETVALWRQLWTSDGPSSFHGQVLRFDAIPPATAPYRPGGPAIWLGGASPSALARAGAPVRRVAALPARPGRLRDRARAGAAGGPGRRPGGEAITPALFASVLIADDAAGGRAALEDFSRANYRMPLEQLEAIQVVLTGPPEYVAAGLGRYIAAGARHLVCRIAAPTLRSQREQLERIAGIFPLLRGGAG